ncbi:MAG: glycosyl hydrolase family 65 protein [Solirubrobacteraceae bacterium]
MSTRARWAAGVVLGLIGLVGSPATAAAAANSGSFVLTATNTGSRYAPTFTGNGLLGVRVGPAGQGYAGGTVPAQSELAGFYAKPSQGKAPELVQQRANIPSWSALSFADGGSTFAPFQKGKTSGWRQSIDLRTGVISTTARWTAPDGHVTDISYQVFTDRAREHVGVVALTLRPHWTGTATVTDAIDGTADRVTGPQLPPVLTSQTGKAWNLAGRSQWLSVQTLRTGITATLADQLVPSSNITAPSTETDQAVSQSVGQQVSFPVTAGQTYMLTKYAGVEDSQTATDPVTSAQLDATGAVTAGATALRAENDAAWAKLWQGRIDVAGNHTVATDVNASEFYLWSSTRDDQDWSVSPAGLSSNGYDGHIFWDAETWMYPSLLAQHPDLASAMETYRYNRLQAAEQHAAATGSSGARFPWESALDGTEQIPPPVSVNSEGLYEQHITADIALAQWQYFLTTGDTQWLRTRGWPVISGAATFWASRAVRGAGSSYHLRHVTGPDEENPNVTDEAFTNVGAKTTLRDALAAAKVLGQPVPANWSTIAAGLVVPVKAGVHPEFAGYRSQLVKQGDVTLLQYPWRFPMSARVAQADLNFYVPRTDPGGPSMSDAVNSIDSSQLGSPGCSSFAYTQRSYEPFIRDVFHQFSETKTGGAFTFMTGIGGFLQEFLYGYSGLRWNAGDVRIAPSLTAQQSGVTLRNLQWHGATFTISVGLRTTTVTLDSGAPLPVSTPGGRHTVTAGHPLAIRTARPDLKPTTDIVRCQNASSTSAEPGQPALAAVDGSPATDWQATTLPATLTVATHAGRRMINRAVIQWGHLWPVAPKPNVHPAPTPVRTVRASSYVLQASTDGYFWHTVATVSGIHGRSTDVLHFPAVHARYVRIRMTKGITDDKTSTGTVKLAPMLQELDVS